MWISSLLKVGNYSLDNKDHVNPSEKKQQTSILTSLRSSTDTVINHKHLKCELTSLPQQNSCCSWKLTEIHNYAWTCPSSILILCYFFILILFLKNGHYMWICRFLFEQNIWSNLAGIFLIRKTNKSWCGCSAN